jgi:hypothetical protein
MVTYAIGGAILEITAQGNYTTAEIAATFADAKRDPGLPTAPRLLLIDFKGSQANPSFADLETRWRLIQQLEPSRIAFLVATVAQARLAQLYEGHGAEAGGAPPIKVFQAPEAAREWLKM